MPPARQFAPSLAEWRSVQPNPKYSQLLKHAHERCWRRVHASIIDGQNQRNVASVRTADPKAAENGRTTSSLRNLRSGLFPCLRARAGGKAKNSNEAFRVFLVVTVAHRERGQISTVERMLRTPAHDRRVALI